MFDDIDETDIKNLLDNEIAERQNLEYKEKVWDQCKYKAAVDG